MASDADAISRLYSTDAVVLYPNQPEIRGRAAIRDYFAAFFAEFGDQRFELASSEVEIAGSWAFDRGTYSWSASARSGGEHPVDQGKFLVILRRQTDGSWQVARDMDNSDKPLTQATRGTP